VGVNRGGTSAIAASLNALGMFLGDSWHEPIYEDLELAHAFRQKDWKSFRRKISGYESRHAVFGWKLPDITKHLFKTHRLFSNPKYSFVFRDIYSIANRLSHIKGENLLENMLYANRQYERILKFITKRNPSALFLSYEKILVDTQQYAVELLDFLEMEKTQEHIDCIISSISPSPKKYQQWAQASRQSQLLKQSGYMGHLDHLDEKKVTGWIKSISNDNPVELDIYVNEQKINRIRACHYRPDLIQARVSRTGKHGFSFKFDQELNAGDKISARPTNISLDLIGSPRSMP
jgi:hypothetical protein